MNEGSKATTATAILGVVALLFTLGVAVDLRLDDPLSSQVIPAEDPYRHMAFTREYLRTGTIEPIYKDQSLYPPGIHTTLAAVWVYTGADLHEIIRIGPVLLGALGVLGMGVLLWRHQGPVAAFVGSLGYAVAPEIVFRTTMMAPTAFDLALAPFLFYALLEIVHGRTGWSAMALPFLLYFVFAHPWFLGILVISILLFVVFSLLFQRPSTEEGPMVIQGLAVVTASVGGSLGLAMTGLGGFTTTMVGLLPSFLQFDAFPYLVIALSVSILVTGLRHPHAAARLLPTREGPMPVRTRAVLSLLIATAMVAVTLPALQGGLPAYVDLPLMFGWPLLLLGMTALVFLPFFTTRLGLLGAALIAATYPLVIHNVYNNEWLPHRIAAFFGIGLAIMLGVAATGATRWITRTVSASDATPASALALPTILVVASMGGAVYSTPEYPWGWYRLYDECGDDALQEIAGTLNADPHALALAGSWQSWIVLMGYTEDPSRVWVGHWWMEDYDLHHEDTLERQLEKNSSVHLVIDPHTQNELSPEDLVFLEDPMWHEQKWCSDDLFSGIALYTHPAPS